MKNKKYPWLIIVGGVALLIIAVFIVYFFFVREPSLSPFQVNVTVGNNPPQIIYVRSIGNVLPVGSSSAPVNFILTVYDIDQASDINDSTARGNFQRTGQQTRENLSCSLNAGETTANSKNYTCTIAMWYFDYPGSWSINSTIKDIYGKVAENSTTSFNYLTLLSFSSSPSGLTWPTLSIADQNQTANESLLINNTGNSNSTLNITAFDLAGEANPNEFIFAGNFTVSINAGVSACAGDVMANATAKTITNSQLLRGNYTINDGTGQERLYFCIPALNPISPDTYKVSNPALSWQLELGGNA